MRQHPKILSFLIGILLSICLLIIAEAILQLNRQFRWHWYRDRTHFYEKYKPTYNPEVFKWLKEAMKPSVEKYIDYPTRPIEEQLHFYEKDLSRKYLFPRVMWTQVSAIH